MSETHKKIVDPYKILGVPYTATIDDIKKAYKNLAKLHHPGRPGGNAELFDFYRTITIKLLSQLQEKDRIRKEQQEIEEKIKFQKRSHIVEGDNDKDGSDMMYNVDDSVYKERDMSAYLRDRDDLGSSKNLFGNGVTKGLPSNFNSIFEQLKEKNKTSDDDDDEIDPIPTEIGQQLSYSEYKLNAKGERVLNETKHMSQLNHANLGDTFGEMEYRIMDDIDFSKPINTKKDDAISQKQINDKLRERDRMVTIDRNAKPRKIEFAHDTSLEDIKNLQIRSFDSVTYDTSDRIPISISSERKPARETYEIVQFDIDSDIANAYSERLKQQQRQQVPVYERSRRDDVREMAYDLAPLSLTDAICGATTTPKQYAPEYDYTQPMNLPQHYYKPHSQPQPQPQPSYPPHPSSIENSSLNEIDMMRQQMKNMQKMIDMQSNYINKLHTGKYK